MNTLLICLSGPLQSWGESARFNLRPTQQTPTKSGVLGLVCAAMGIARSDTATLSKLNQLRFGVRVDCPGQLLIDFHTVQKVVNVEGKIPQDTTPTERYYLAGAVFLAGLEGNDRALLETIHCALLKPRWLLSLGRKSCIPGERPWLQDGLKDDSLENALRRYKSLHKDAISTFLEVEDSTGSLRMDNPLHFGQRQYSPRLVRTLPLEAES
ncbi:type I-E CRISPR-associated protein Cas5/CasD [Leptolyngbya sp. FACHB-321]|uniref:type I-E CRISPR-associated protein Cas5/CasD n=1 Tax=Leptolyngbya sp. FACHB-321 TaxID=2692807 RepID=UPI00168A38BE|nr:type I-E CRISPR-associated protein Cas5/CasD [Leptolyngbya sp. FACHB-321]MBD2037761.1 type I-E CRISPR-associated protein Cas5/CasD [Leptolyngbya sp. FACHB-321]